MPSAKERFQTTEHAKRFLNMASAPEFITACDYAMLQVCSRLSTNPDTRDRVEFAASSEFRRQGAQLFRETLESIADVSAEQKVEDRRNLKPQP